MTITTEQAVALAEKHGAIVSKPLSASFLDFKLTEQQLTAMLNDPMIQQQVIERLVQESGVMPQVIPLVDAEEPICIANEVREAIATMQARVEQQKKSHQELADRFWKAAARVEQLEKVLCEIEKLPGISSANLYARRALAAMNKESGK